MNILFIVTKSEIGGAQKYVKEQVEICSGIFKIFVATNRAGWLTEAVSCLAAGFFLDARIEKRASLSYLFALKAFIKQNKIGLIIASSAYAGLYGRIAAKMAGIPGVYVSHGWSSVYNGGKLAFLLNKVEYALGKISSKVICISDADYHIATDVIRIPAGKIILLKNCIFPMPDKSSEYANLERLKLLSVARFCPPKRMDILVAAMQEVDFADLHIIGGGPEFDSVQSYIRENKLGNVSLHGEIENFRDFNLYDAFVLISDSEGLPMSALEAMSAGLPAVMSDVGGCRELVLSETLLVKNTPEDIVRALKALKTNFSRFEAGIKPFFDKNFNLHMNKYKFLNFYRSYFK